MGQNGTAKTETTKNETNKNRNDKKGYGRSENDNKGTVESGGPQSKQTDGGKADGESPIPNQ